MTGTTGDMTVDEAISILKRGDGTLVRPKSWRQDSIDEPYRHGHTAVRGLHADWYAVANGISAGCCGWEGRRTDGTEDDLDGEALLRLRTADDGPWEVVAWAQLVAEYEAEQAQIRARSKPCFCCGETACMGSGEIWSCLRCAYFKMDDLQGGVAGAAGGKCPHHGREALAGALAALEKGIDP